MKPDWKKIADGIYWCRDFGSMKIEQSGCRTRYLIPRMEKSRRKEERGYTWDEKEE